MKTFNTNLMLLIALLAASFWARGNECAVPHCEINTTLRPVSSHAHDYTLIIVTYGADVKHSRGYATLRMCLQAKSIATTGWTIEQNKAHAAEIEKLRREADAEWRRAHPPRVPTAKDRKECWSGGGGYSSSGAYCTIKDGMAYDWPASLVSISSGNYYVQPDRIKHAECVIEVTQ